MSRRLLYTGGIPILGLLLLFAGLALVTRDLADPSVTYAGREYTGGAIVTVASDELVPTELRLDGLQVWLPRIAVAVPPTIYLQRADGRFHRYRLEDAR
ncbi:MAG TPA: hypothetical protein VNP93_11775 [Gaiellaceae bacterium]|nr:hypothetical protein [Gaiellaceae bacterium]